MSTTLVPPTRDPLDDLRARVSGRVLLPGDVDFDVARRGFNLRLEQHPAVVVEATCTADVVAAIDAAREAGRRVAVKATGHGTAGLAHDALLLETSRMTGVVIDGAARTARIAAGTKWGPVIEAAQQVGLAPLLGSTTDVGAIGYTLGGGFGWLGRKYGLSADNVISFEVVTADGAVRAVSADEHPDLFWALRGGGAGNLAVVTSMEIRLFPVSSVYAGNLFYPAQDAREVMARWRDWVTDAPDDLTSSVVVMNFPPVPMVPEPIRGQSFVIVRGCWCGTDEEGERVLAPWREWRQPVLDMWGPMPFAAVDQISNDPVDPLPAVVSTEWLSALDDTAIDALVRVLPDGGPPPLLFAEVRHVGGAVRRADAGSAAYGNRDAELLLEVVGLTLTPEAHTATSAFVADLRQKLAPVVTGGAYLNFTEGEEKRDRTRAGFTAEAWERLRAVKAAVDPDDLFGHGLAIPPAEV